MKWLVCHPGADSSVSDVFAGVTAGLKADGIAYAEFRLDGRIDRAHGWLHYLWRRTKRSEPGRVWPKPTPADVLLHASMGLVERALMRNCDAILVITAMYLQPDMLTLARRAGLQVYLICTESPYEMVNERRLAALCDVVWTNERTAVPMFLQVCKRVAYLPAAWLPGVHDRAQVNGTGVAAHDVIFVGTFFEERVKLLEAVDWTGIDLGLYGNTYMISKRSPLRSCVRGGITPNAITAGLYRRAKIGLNLYRQIPADLPAAESLNPRAYELAAAGVCQVSEERAEAREVFGEAVSTFRTAGELSQCVRTLLADDEQRGRMGAAARQAVVTSTWQSRIQQMRRDLEVREQPAARSLTA